MKRFSWKYIDSHIYDIYAIFVGTLTLAVVMILKIPIKIYSRRIADIYCKEYCGDEEEQEKEWLRFYKKVNGFIFVLVIAVALIVFAVVAQISSQIEFSWGSAIMSAIYAIAEYEVIDQII